ncbi:hypothetical protein JCM8097_002211 [Rhodosporidiobolus ruineniae]
MRAKRQQQLAKADREACQAAFPPPPSPPPARPPRQLPPELLDLVLEQLSRGWESEQADLAQCCLVSQTFLALARPRLYRVLELRLGPPESLNPDIVPVDKSAFLALATLTGNPRLASLVRAVWLSLTCPPEERVDRVRLSTVVLLSLHLPEIEELHVRHEAYIPYCVEALQDLHDGGVKPGLKRVVAGGPPQQIDRLLHWVEPSTLEHVSLRVRQNHEGRYAGYTPLHLDRLPIRSLDLSHPAQSPAPLLKTVLSLAAPTLTSLTLCVDWSFLKLDSFSQLRHLRLNIPLGAAEGDKGGFIDRFPAELASCARLKTLAIASAATSFTLSNIRTLTSSSPSALPANLPSSLVALHLYSPHFYPSDLLSLVRASPQAINLRQLGREPYRLPLGERDRKKRPSLPSDEEIDELNEVCRERGITVVALPGGNNE